MVRPADFGGRGLMAGLSTPLTEFISPREDM